MNIILQPWPWYVAGPMIALVMMALLYFGREFGFSSNLRTICAMSGAGKNCDFFRFNWKDQKWNLMFVLGSVIGGFVAVNYLSSEPGIALASDTVASLSEIGFNQIGAHYLPDELFGDDNVFTLKGISILFIGGLLVGFGARYAGGCTSGHAISGLSNLQLPSLIAVIGFFIGGLLMVYFILPHLF